jgi:hypothetical protein
MRRARSVVWLVPVLAVGIGIGSLWSAKKSSPAPVAPILQQVRALGELRTARYTYQTVFEHTTSREPEAWVRYVPGGESLVHAATRNEALVSAHATVDAGVDLRHATVERAGDRLVVTLPRAQVYEPVVRARVHDAERGWFWRDENIGLKAAETAGEQIVDNARRQGIRKRAETEAVTRVRALVGPEADIRFAE